MIVKELIEMLKDLDQEQEVKYNSDGMSETDFAIEGIDAVGHDKTEYYLIV